MKPLFVLVFTFVISALILKLIYVQVDYQLAARIAMAIMMVFTAIGHFTYSKGMAEMIPGFIPLKLTVVYATGFLEIFLAIGSLLPRFQVISGWILIVFFVLILPANIRAAIKHINYQTGELNGSGLSYLWFRIPLQIIFILWVYLSSIYDVKYFE